VHEKTKGYFKEFFFSQNKSHMLNGRRPNRIRKFIYFSYCQFLLWSRQRCGLSFWQFLLLDPFLSYWYG